MPSDVSPKGPSFLLSVLRDGGRPFAYRSGVAKLLGQSPGAGLKAVFRGVLPPVSFYTAKPEIPILLPEEGRSPLQNKFEGPVPMSRKQDQESSLWQACGFSAVGRPNSELVNEPLEKAQPNSVMPEARLAQSGLQSSEASTDVSLQKIQKTKIEIPGFSAKAQVFPAMETQSQPEVIAELDKVTDKAADKEEPAESPIETQNSAPDPISARAVPVLKPAPQFQAPHGLEITQKASAEGLSSEVLSSDEPLFVPPTQIAPISAPVESQVGRISSTSIRPSQFERPFSDVLSQRPRSKTDNANAEHLASFQIRHLRQSVQALQAKTQGRKQGQSESKNTDSDWPQAPTELRPPPRPLVIVRPSKSLSASAISTFWARRQVSTLFCMRVLR